MSHNSQSNQESGYVNIHGDDIETLICEESGNVLVPIEQLKNVGVHILRRTQFNKLSSGDNQFTEEFDHYMLQAAQTYIQDHKITFTEETIVESINKAKQKLAGYSDKSFDHSITVTTKEKQNERKFTTESPDGSGCGRRKERIGFATILQNTKKMKGHKILANVDAFPTERLPQIKLKNPKLQIQIKSQNSTGTYVVETPSVKAGPEFFTEETFFNKPESMCKLENDQKVMAVAINNGKLTVRTKECFDKVRKIEKALGQIEAMPIQIVFPGQLVLCNKNDKLYRAEVTGVRGRSVDVQFLDYNENMELNISALRNIPQSVVSEPITYAVTPKIKGYIAKSENMIKNLINSEVQMTVVLIDSEFDLKVGEELLSRKLTEQSEHSGRVMLAHLKCYKPKIGVGQYIFNSLRNTEDLSFAHDETFNEYIEIVIKTELEDCKPYIPRVGEVCYGLFEGNWFRCVVINDETNFRYKVQFIDFGNVEVLRKELLRKATNDMKNAPIIAIPCKLTGIPQVANCEELVQKYLETSHFYELDIKRFDGEMYEIEIPGLYEKLRST